LVSQMNSGKVKIMTDHGNSVDNVVGKITKAWVQNNRIFYQGEVLDEEISTKIKRGYLNKVSVHGIAKQMFCAQCLQPTKDKFGCENHRDAGVVISGLTLSEVSLVVSPAYPNTSIHPM